MKKAFTNRELFFLAKDKVKNSNSNISDNEIYLLLEYVNNYQNYTEIVLNFDKICENCRVFDELLDEVISGKPIQYVLKQAQFLDFNFYVDESVLIPRPETEGLVLKTISYIDSLNLNHDNIADICTGSGAIAISLKHKFHESKVFASDINKRCLNVARKNADKYNQNIIFFEGDKLNPFINNNLKLDVQVSNPPYVENADDIEEKVKKYEPNDAVYIKDGTEFYEEYFKHHKDVLNENFFMAFEINYDQELKLTELIKKYFDKNVRYKFEKDIYNLTRYLFILGGYEDKTIN
ncbi:MAG: peptide chain release factor N(5)-glutamine methyltransferase [Bacilli bacterium]|nr:peptide chain release factor N(5)-glutamine methyltransferase [Bacilli bacterium]